MSKILALLRRNLRMNHKVVKHFKLQLQMACGLFISITGCLPVLNVRFICDNGSLNSVALLTVSLLWA